MLTLVALQPCSNPVSKEHFERTVEREVALAEVLPYVDPEARDALRDVAVEGRLRLWGQAPGENGVHIPKWDRLAIADRLLFAFDGGYRAVGAIAFKFESESLARHLWGELRTKNQYLQTWNLMYALHSFEIIDYPYAQVNKAIGRKLNSVPQKFDVLDVEQSRAALGALGRNNHPNGTNDTDSIKGGVYRDEDTLEKRYWTSIRVEQSALRSKLLQEVGYRCELCGRGFSAAFLSAAHIKRRSVSSITEKKMALSIAMLNCRFGCDDLFGQGWISVDRSGSIVVSPVLPDGAASVFVRDHLEGRRSLAWDSRPGTRPFFQFHFERDFRQLNDVERL